MFKKNESIIGKTVKLTEIKSSCAGHFEKNSIVKITDVDHHRGYTFEDEHGNKVTEAGFSGFDIL